MDDITAPKAAEDVRDLWKVVAAVVRFVNNFRNGTVNPKGTQNKITVSDGNINIELNAADLGGGSGSTLTWDVIINGAAAQSSWVATTPVYPPS